MSHITLVWMRDFLLEPQYWAERLVSRSVSRQHLLRIAGNNLTHSKGHIHKPLSDVREKKRHAEKYSVPSQLQPQKFGTELQHLTPTLPGP